MSRPNQTARPQCAARPLPAATSSGRCPLVRRQSFSAWLHFSCCPHRSLPLPHPPARRGPQNCSPLPSHPAAVLRPAGQHAQGCALPAPPRQGAHAAHPARLAGACRAATPADCGHAWRSSRAAAWRACAPNALPACLAACAAACIAVCDSTPPSKAPVQTHGAACCSRRAQRSPGRSPGLWLSLPPRPPAGAGLRLWVHLLSNSGAGLHHRAAEPGGRVGGGGALDCSR